MVGEKAFKQFAKPFFIIVLLVTISFASLIPNTKFDYDFEKFFPKEDVETAFYFKHRELFQSDNDFLLIAIERKNGIFNKNFLNQVENCQKELSKVKYVTYARAITNEKEIFLLTGGAVGQKPFFSKKTNLLKEDSIRIYNHPELINSLVAKDGKSLCIFVKHKDFLPGKKSSVLIDEVQTIVKKYSFEKVRIAGRTIGQKFYIGKMTNEMLLFVSISMVLVVLFLWIAFKSLWGIILPQLVIVTSVIWIMGSMVIINEPVNIILSILPSIMFVVAMSDVIHMVSRYLDALRTGLTKYDAIVVSLKEVGLATLLTSITTAVGFLTLMLINVQPIQSFGYVTAIGVSIAFVATILILPVSFYIFPTPKNITKSKEFPLWNKYLRIWFLAVLKNRKKVLFVSGILILLFTGLSFMLKSNNFLMDDLRSSEPIKQDFDFLDKHYGGVRPFELALTIPDTTKDCWDKEVLLEIDKIERYLVLEYKAKMNVSLGTFIKILNQASNLGNPKYFELPDSNRKLRRLKQPLKMAQSGKLYKIVVDSTERYLRISASLPDLGNNIVTEKNEKFKDFIKNNIDSNLVQVKLTGTPHLLDKNMSYLSTSLIQGIILSILIITLIMGFVYKSWKIVVISLIPNVIPLLVLSGLMGLFAIDLKISTAIIFTISFGIAVDDTIHFLGKFKLELSKGKSKLYALKTTYLTTGKAMILTTLILCSGFLMLLFSSFMGTFTMGFMISISLFVALIADLTLLPVLLLMFYNPKK
jgi:predicted RND superfamily exporter protein